MEAIRDLPEVLFVTEVASLLRVSKMTVYRAINDGDLEAVKFGRSFRVPKENLVTYLTKG
jgi:excisionase family DNA binding protein